MVASFSGHVTVMELLLSHGAVITATDHSGSQAIHHAVDGGSSEAVYLLLQRGANVNARESSQWTPLLRASTAEWSIAYQITSYPTAAMNSTLDVCKVLLENGADVNAKDLSGQTPLMVCHVPIHMHPLTHCL